MTKTLVNIPLFLMLVLYNIIDSSVFLLACYQLIDHRILNKSNMLQEKGES